MSNERVFYSAGGRWLIHLWGKCMTFAKLTKAMEAASVFWVKIAPVLRDMIHHYQDIMADGLLTPHDIEKGRENVIEFRKALGDGK